MKKNPVSPNQMGLPFTEAPYMPKDLPPPPPPITARNILVRPKWKVTEDGHIYPEMRFGGSYLEKAGFLIGQEVSLTVRKNKVVIAAISRDPQIPPIVQVRLENIKTRRRSSAALRSACV